LIDFVVNFHPILLDNAF